MHSHATLKVSLFFIIALTVAALVSACQDNPVGETGPSDATTIMPELATNSSDNTVTRVSICHFPPGNPSNPKAIAVAEKAAAAHITHHDGDGVIGEDYDEACEPIDDSDDDEDPPSDPSLPDLTLADVSGTPLEPDPETGDFKSDIVITIANIGLSATEEFNVALGDGTVRVPGMGAGATLEVTTSVFSTQEEGIFEIMVRLDVDDEVAEADETNNSFNVTMEYLGNLAPDVTVTALDDGSDDDEDPPSDPSLPDLTLADVSGTPLEPDPETGDFKSDIVITIANIGLSATEEFNVALGDGTVRVPGMGAGATLEVTTSVFSAQEEGIFEIMVRLDVDDEVAEADETNNSFNVTMEYLGNLAPDVTVTALDDGS